MQSNDGQLMLQQANQLYRQGQMDQAYERAMASPDSPARYRILVSVLIARAQPADIKKALKLIDQWKRKGPTSPEPWARQIEIHIYKQELALAHRAFNELQRRAREDSKTFFYKGLLLQLSGKSDSAYKAHRHALSLEPVHARNRSSTAVHTIDVIAAMRMCDVARGVYPGSREKNNLLLLNQPAELQRLENNLQHLAEAIKAGGQPASGEEKALLARGWFRLGSYSIQADDRIRHLEKAVHWNENHEEARENLLFNYNYSSQCSAEEIFEKHRAAGRRLRDKIYIPAAVPINDTDHTRPLRIGYLSSDFRDHPVACFILPVLQNHDPEKTRFYLYHNHRQEDRVTNLARQGCEKFYQTHTLSDEELAGQVARDRIDILVDLNGLSEGNRISFLARRSAPIQISWIGYPNTTGLDSIDYRIVDEVTDPKPGAQDLYVEQLLYMPKTFSVYQPLDEMPPVVPAPSIKSGFITFGSFNNLVKLDNEVLEAWAEILKQVPDSRLLIKDLALSFDKPRKRILKVFTDLGIESNRIECLGRDKRKTDHFMRFHAVDICLDSYPYNGTTTSCESLFMGVPVVTWAGTDHRSRVTASQLKAVDLKNLVAHNKIEYIDLAVKLASDQTLLTSSREGLRERMQESALMDAPGFTHELETVFRKIWIGWCEQQESENIAG